ncbi:amidase [Microbacterium insulae]|uniref:Amidase n=1 Tax=Microbacterium insulae TaxID=483014 RepID=A0ABW3AGA8_9MICO
MTDDVTWLSAAQLAERYRRRELSPVEVVDAALTRIDRVDPSINAFVTVTTDEARARARVAEERLWAGEALPPLFGIPITVKDLTDTAGVRTTYGSTIFQDHVPTADAISWERLKACGVILIGKTTTPEFGLLGTTESHLSGTTSNPWDCRRTSGGSSGGAAAATAAGVTPLAWGSDGGGSIRVPASLCGTVGFKASLGRIPLRDSTDPSTTEGPITRTVLDAGLLLDATAGPDHRDRFALPHTGESFSGAARNPRDLRGVRIAVSPDLGIGRLDSETRAGFESAVNRLQDAGAFIEPVDVSLPDVLEYFVAYWGPEYIAVADDFAASGTPLWPLISEIADRARALDPRTVSDALRGTRTLIYNEYMRILGPCEFLVTPTTPMPAPLHSEILADNGDFGLSFALHRLTESATHAGLPAISVPAAFTSGGLPIGLQVIGRPRADASVLSIAAAFEQLSDAGQRHPH